MTDNMRAQPFPPSELLLEFGVSAPRFVEETAVARIWQVDRADGTQAALKHYLSEDMGNEHTGIAFLRAANGAGAALAYAQTPAAVLMEWLPGPSLGDLSRDGHDAKAAEELVSVANRLHLLPRFHTTGWPKLDGWFAPLFEVQFAPECTHQIRQSIQRSQAIARHLLTSQTDTRPLHGDLHHDNIRHGPRGYCAFDAKGVVGERAYELANAFRNPKGVPDLLRDPARLRFLRDLWSGAFDVDAQDLMGWAVAKVGLSIAWRCKGGLTSDPELDLLDLMISVLDEC